MIDECYEQATGLEEGFFPRKQTRDKEEGKTRDVG